MIEDLYKHAKTVDGGVSGEEAIKQWYFYKGFEMGEDHERSVIESEKFLSGWINIDHAATRVILGSDPDKVENRVAFIEKTPRVRVSPYRVCTEDFRNWVLVGSSSSECGKDADSRALCDKVLVAMGYTLL